MILNLHLLRATLNEPFCSEHLNTFEHIWMPEMFNVVKYTTFQRNRKSYVLNMLPFEWCCLICRQPCKHARMCRYWIRIETMLSASFQFWFNTGIFCHVYCQDGVLLAPLFRVRRATKRISSDKNSKLAHQAVLLPDCPGVGRATFVIIVSRSPTKVKFVTMS